MKSISELKKALIDQKKSATWDELATKYDVNKGVLWMIVHEDYEPKKEDIRRKLGLPIMLLVPHKRNKLGRFTEIE